MNNEIKAGSKLLAEFDGLEIHATSGEWVKPECGIQFLLSDEELTYHTDYNEIMRVWRKFRDLGSSLQNKEDESEHERYKELIEWRIINFDDPSRVFDQLVEAVTWLKTLDYGKN